METALITPEDLMEGAAATIMGMVAANLETEGPNAGPLVNLILASVGQPPGKSWCAATAYYVYRLAANKLYTTNPCPRTAGCLRMWELADPHWRTNVPRRGAIYILDHGKGLGHAGVVTAAAGGLVRDEVSGNTFTKGGGRQGNSIALHHGPPEKTHGGKLVGYIDFARHATIATT